MFTCHRPTHPPPRDAAAATPYILLLACRRIKGASRPQLRMLASHTTVFSAHSGPRLCRCRERCPVTCSRPCVFGCPAPAWMCGASKQQWPSLVPASMRQTRGWVNVAMHFWRQVDTCAQVSFAPARTPIRSRDVGRAPRLPNSHTPLTESWLQSLPGCGNWRVERLCVFGCSP